MEILKFSKTHEWIKIEGNFATIGITDYAQKALGDIVFIELLVDVGVTIKQGKQFGIIESTKAATELYSPLSGEVIEINKELLKNPQWISEDCFLKGWMIKIKIIDAREIDNLLDEVEYKEFISGENK